MNKMLEGECLCGHDREEPFRTPIRHDHDHGLDRHWGACLRLSLGSERLQTNRVHPCAILPFVLNHNETAVFGPTIIKAVSEDRTWTPRYSTNPAYPAGT